MTAPDHGNDDFPWANGVYDAHCHPTDSMNAIDSVPKMQARVLTVMATRAQDQQLVASVADRFGLSETNADLVDGEAPCQVLPAFGWHPWFTHQLYDDYHEKVDAPPSKSDHFKKTLTPSPEEEALIASLPEPKPLSKYMEGMREYLQRYPLALVGEIGLDRSFRIPEPDAPRHEATEPDLTPGGREGRKLTPHRVNMEHQKKILTAQLNLAGEFQRAVSVHGVAAHGILYETLRETWKGHENKVMSKREQKNVGKNTEENEDEKCRSHEPKPYPPRICLHSYSGPPDTLKQYFHPSVPAIIFFSFSQVINFSSQASKKALQVIKAVPDDRILIESDLHRAGDRMDGLLADMARNVCEAKGWSLQEGTERLAENWKLFAFGHT
jgi:Tat protein secretion system quality control protein TatD with DNase activity